MPSSSLVSRRRKRRIAVLLVVLALVGAAFLSAALTSAKTLGHACGGHERWTVKVLIDADADAINFAPRWRAIDTLRKLERPSGFLGSRPRQAPVEFTTYQVRRAF
jgi:hypothetical protein